MKQNTPEWYAWRSQGIGASESPIIMGLSPYKTKLELFKQKTGEPVEEKNENNFVQEKGHRLEITARAKYEFMSGKSYPDKLGVHKDYPFLRASFDGLSDEGDHIEIKYIGMKEFTAINSAADLNKIKPHYYCQIQHQIMITGKDGGLLMINDSNGIKHVSIPIDLPYINNMLPHLLDFWDSVQKKIAPEKTKRDKSPLDENRNTLLSKYKELTIKIKSLETEQENVKKLILADLSPGKYESEHGSITYTERIGSVVYENIPELKGIDLNKYRKPSTGSFTIKV